jgi:hypothetical protein
MPPKSAIPSPSNIVKTRHCPLQLSLAQYSWLDFSSHNPYSLYFIFLFCICAYIRIRALSTDMYSSRVIATSVVVLTAFTHFSLAQHYNFGGCSTKSGPASSTNHCQSIIDAFYNYSMNGDENGNYFASVDTSTGCGPLTSIVPSNGCVISLCYGEYGLSYGAIAAAGQQISARCKTGGNTAGWTTLVGFDQENGYQGGAVTVQLAGNNAPPPPFTANKARDVPATDGRRETRSASLTKRNPPPPVLRQEMTIDGHNWTMETVDYATTTTAHPSIPDITNLLDQFQTNWQNAAQNFEGEADASVNGAEWGTELEFDAADNEDTSSVPQSLRGRFLAILFNFVNQAGMAAWMAVRILSDGEDQGQLLYSNLPNLPPP